MEKTIKIGQSDVRLSNNISWAMCYKDQFGTDIIPTLTPLVAAALDVVSGIFSEADDPNNITLADALKILDGDTFVDMIAHLSGLEFVELIHITWAMAKAADDEIPDPKTWARSLDEFPIDKIAPEVVKLAVKGLVSSKNLKRLTALKNQIKAAQPLTLKPSSLPGSKED